MNKRKTVWRSLPIAVEAEPSSHHHPHSGKGAPSPADGAAGRQQEGVAGDEILRRAPVDASCNGATDAATASTATGGNRGVTSAAHYASGLVASSASTAATSHYQGQHQRPASQYEGEW